MKDKTLLKLATITSITGILILLLIPTQTTTINKLKENQIITIEGIIKEIQTINKLTLITIQDETGTITTTSFEPINPNLNQKIKLTGKTTIYKNQLQIQIHKLEYI